MSFTELCASIEEVNNRVDSHLSLVDKFFEYATSEYTQKQENADLRYISESSSECAVDTLNFLYMEAEEGFIKRSQKTIAKISEILDDFITAMITKVENFLFDKTFDEKMKRIAKKIRLNPFLAKKKILVGSTEKSDAFDSIAHLSNIIVYKLSTVDSDLTDELEDLQSFMDDLRNELDESRTKKKEMTVSELAENYAVYGKAAIKFMRETEKQSKTFFKECNRIAEKLPNAENATTMEKCARIVLNATKLYVNAVYNEWRSEMSELQKIVKDTKSVNADSKKQEKESDAGVVAKEYVSDDFSQSIFEHMYESVISGNSQTSYKRNQNINDENDILSFAKQIGF